MKLVNALWDNIREQERVNWVTDGGVLPQLEGEWSFKMWYNVVDKGGRIPSCLPTLPEPPWWRRGFSIFVADAMVFQKYGIKNIQDCGRSMASHEYGGNIMSMGRGMPLLWGIPGQWIDWWTGGAYASVGDCQGGIQCGKNGLSRWVGGYPVLPIYYPNGTVLSIRGGSGPIYSFCR